jgi:hypothetical protein
MPRYVATIEVARGPRAVWDFLDTPENAPLYVEGCISCVLVAGKRKGVGTRVLRATAAHGVRPTDATEDVLEYHDGSFSRRIGTIAWFATYEATMQVEPIEGGRCRVTFDYTYRPTFLAVVSLFWPFFVLTMRGRIERMAQTAKRVLEADEAGLYRAAG